MLLTLYREACKIISTMAESETITARGSEKKAQKRNHDRPKEKDKERVVEEKLEKVAKEMEAKAGKATPTDPHSGMRKRW
jgi:hypothetical protein